MTWDGAWDGGYNGAWFGGVEAVVAELLATFAAYPLIDGLAFVAAVVDSVIATFNSLGGDVMAEQAILGSAMADNAINGSVYSEESVSGSVLAIDE